MKRQLIRIKEILVNYNHLMSYELDAYDLETIEYLIDTIDYLLQGRIPCTKSIISVVIDDVMLASSFQKSTELLEVVSILNDIKESCSCLLSE